MNATVHHDAPCLSTSGLACERGDRLLFANLDLRLDAGEAVQVAGPNGCGKTTLLRVLCGLVLPSAGTVRWRGRPIDDDPATLHADLCYLGYAGGVKLELSARENLACMRALHSNTAATLDLDEALDRVDLAGFEDVPAYTLSAGQRRRISLARLLSSAAPLWILDEPLTALDRDGTTLVEMLLDAHLRGGGLLVFTTHQALAGAPAGTRTLELG